MAEHQPACALLDESKYHISINALCDDLSPTRPSACLMPHMFAGIYPSVNTHDECKPRKT